jgi:hypothetical protein
MLIKAISTNTFYNPAHFADRKVPTTLIARNLMQAHHWGLKTFYYSLINKAGSKQTAEAAPLEAIDFDLEVKTAKPASYEQHRKDLGPGHRAFDGRL